MSSSRDRPMVEPLVVRPSLSTSLSDFALSSSTSTTSLLPTQGSAQGPVPGESSDDSAPLMKRMQRPTVHSWYLADSRMNSPLATSFTVPPPRKPKGRVRGGGGDPGSGFRDKDRMTTDSSSPSSESDITGIPTPPPRPEYPRTDEIAERPKSSPMDVSRSASPASALKPSADIQDAPGPSQVARRLSCPPRPARLLTLRSEARPEDSEVKSEAQFQRLLASFSDLPPGLGYGRSARAASDRGRYPEEAGGDEEFQREETPSDEENDGETLPPTLFGHKAHGGSEPINITKPSTPVQGIEMPEDAAGARGISESPGYVMDIDVPMYAIGSPALTASGVPPMQWRHTPPPISVSAVRTAKRKYEDRFDPYAPSSKRRAVSPSISYLKERELLVSPIVIPRSPILKPRKSFSQSQANSATSSPTISHSASGHFYGNGGGFSLPLQTSAGNGHHRSGSSSSVVSSPTVRASMILGSPILRPIPRLAGGLKRAAGDEERIVDGAGENLRDLNIGR
ncbi:hypothetical protein M0805_007140 [Coniferiporia weirii]|nr:hypothetical protein M0805_007140 [Coniferiporia weirii]